ncbi:uncharacterized protein H6S33_012980 [Morchella sextelata]|uniref:uncharacterized protein n=1 Tax=Morchella sextelata TaxID=1174677 RepID=UPI001D059D45|nr:uncharacterized protein H6S33_012980 [Morchella sextelata]KAH0609494.1 hypothetical protein H6S33_012980 [Morchella sextelata]
MAPGAPRGKRKVVRGRGRDFSRNLQPLDREEGSGEIEGMWADPRDPKPAVESSSEEEESDDDDDEPVNKAEMTREERKAADKARKAAALARKAASAPEPGDLPSGSEDEDDEPAPVVKKKAPIAVANPNAAGVVDSALNRKEREAVEAAAAKERYWKLQEQGKTDQARADMARLAIIRQERDEKARQRKAELEERKAAAEAKASSSGRRK